MSRCGSSTSTPHILTRRNPPVCSRTECPRWCVRVHDVEDVVPPSAMLAEGIADGLFERQHASFRMCCLRGVISVEDGRDPGALLFCSGWGQGQPHLLAQRVRSSKESRGASGLTSVSDMQILTPLTLGPRTAPTRVMFGPHVTNLGADDRSLTPRHVAYYERRAAGGSASW